MTQPTDDVKEHLKKRGIDPESLSDDVIKKFNAFGKGELKKVDDLGDALMQDDSVANPTKISAVH
jgi:hypothetical protein